MRQILLARKNEIPTVTLNNFSLGREDVVFYEPRGLSAQIGILIYDNNNEYWGFRYHRHLIKNRNEDMHFRGKSANRSIGLATEKGREVFVASYDEFIKYLGERA